MSELDKQIDAFIEDNREKILADIARIVAVPSVRSEPEEGAPFGREPRRALDTILSIAQEMGFATGVCKDAVGWAELPGEDKEKYLATVTHVDVVPAGKGWTSDPFTMIEKEGFMIGRGVLDDKGPSILCLYILKYLKENNINLRYPIRTLFGTAEETGMEDVPYYLDNQPSPAFAFSPDADFPLCNGEKGNFQAKATAKAQCVNILEMEGGEVVNAVPDTARAVIRTSRTCLPKEEGIDISKTEDGFEIVAHGVAGHASRPESTVNAIGVLVDYILSNELADEAEIPFLEFVEKLMADYNGRGLDVYTEDDKFGKITIIGGTCGITDGHLWQTMDSRYPTSTTGEELEEKILKASEGCMTIEILGSEKPFYIEADSAPIRACIDAYNEVTGENKKPFTIGGGTYARNFPYAVSFGPEHMDRPFPDFVGDIHSADEGARISDMLEALKIYIKAMLKLQQIEF